MLLMLIYTVVGAALLTVITAAGALAGWQRALTGVADSAALAAAGQLDERRLLVSGGGGEQMPLDPEQVIRTVDQLAAAQDLVARFPGFAIVEVRTDADVVTVRLATRVPLPVVRWMGGDLADGVRIVVEAHARSPYRQLVATPGP